MSNRHDDTDELPIVETPATQEPPASPGWPRRLVVAVTAVLVLLAVAVALLVVNAVLARSIEQHVAEEFEAHTGTPADVRLHGFPVGLRALTGRVPLVELSATDVPLPEEDAVATEVHVELTDVRVDRDAQRVEAANADVRLTLDDEAVQQLLGALGRVPLTDIELRAGTLRLNVAGFAVADATASVDAGALVFRLTAPLDRLISAELRVDDLPLGLRADAVAVTDGELRISASAAPFALER